MTFAQLRALVAVVDAGSFQAAADALVMTPSAVSHAVRSLEAELGAALLVRGPGGVRETAAGASAVARARAMIADADALRSEVGHLAGALGGRLRVGTVPSVSARILPAILSGLARSAPGLSIVGVEGSDGEVAEWVARGTVEVGLLGRGAVALPDAVDCELLLRDALMAVVAVDHPLAAGDAVSVSALSGEAFVMSSGGCEPLVRAVAAGAGVDLRVVHEVRDAASLVALVGEGLGVTVMPELAIPASTHVRALPLVPAASRELLAVSGRDPEHVGARSAFLTEARRVAARGAERPQRHAPALRAV